jgi:hypothetical protein
VRVSLFASILLFSVLIARVPAFAAAPAPIHLARLTAASGFGSGAFAGTTLEADHLTLARGEVSGTWTSTVITTAASFTRLVASWNADTPAASSMRIQARTTTDAGETSDWYTMGVWAADDAAVGRSSVTGQSDSFGKVETDTLMARGSPFVSYWLRVRLDRATPDDPSPTVRLLAAEASSFAYSQGQATSTPLSTDPVELSVSPFAQEVHARQYPQWGGGGEAWCSPTSTEMVIEYWGRGPTADDLSWVDGSYADPSVDFAARSTYDAAYRGTGNWPFNTAYAARYGLEAFVTQLHSLAEVEQFIRAGIPLVASIASRPGELDGFLFSGGTNGHLVVIVGFDGQGQPIVNDPAAWTNGGVRRVYDRAQFERVWLRGSAGTVYVIHPPEVALPSLIAALVASW